MRSKVYKSPVGDLTVTVSERGVLGVLWPDDKKNNRVSFFNDAEGTKDKGNKAEKVLEQTCVELTEYFEERRDCFDVVLDWPGVKGTEFQKKVWKQLVTIPYGETISYGGLAEVLKMSSAVRAVASAVGKNPISIMAPCHRIVGAKGQLTGFAGGLEAKKILLDHERNLFC